MSEVNFESVLTQLMPAAIPGAIRPLAARALQLRRIADTYSSLHRMDHAESLPQRLLEHLGVTVRIAERDLANVARKGGAVLVANHPFGILEGAILARLLLAIRPDVRILANGLLSAVPELADLIIPVDPDSRAESRSGNGHGLREAIRFVAAGGLLVVFPAGAVSHFQWREGAVADPEWNPAALRLALAAARRSGGVPIIPVFIEGRNSLLFQLAGTLHQSLRTALLPRELFNKKNREVAVRIGTPIESERLLEMESDEERCRYVRWRTYLLAHRCDFKALSSRPMGRVRDAGRQEPVAAMRDPLQMAREVDELPAERTMAESGDLRACLARAAEIPTLLHEIGRLRECTFREAGEGSGKALDLDRFDQHYWHLFVWNAARRELVGAYRMAPVEEIFAAQGLKGLYTADLFRYDHRFIQRLGPALELGRSFVRREYQRAFAPLLLLWKGIGAFVAQSGRYTTLFGPVSISNQYQALSRELMLQFLEKHETLRDWARLVTSRHAPRRLRADGLCMDLDDLADAVSDLEPDRAGVPVLLRQYLRLGGKLIGFNVDPAFSNALDGLILVDLTQTEPKLLERYLGKEAAGKLQWKRNETNGTE